MGFGLLRISSIDDRGVPYLAQAAYNYRDYDLSSRCFKQYLHHHPYHPLYLYQAGVSAFRAGNPDEALTLMGKSLQVLPHQTEVLYQMGLMEVELGKLVSAGIHFDAILSVRPRHHEAQFWSMQTHFALGNLEKTATRMRQLREAGIYDSAVKDWIVNQMMQPASRSKLGELGLLLRPEPTRDSTLEGED